MTPPKDPEELFNELPKNARAPSLWLHQGDVIRSYVKSHVDKPDVVLELPTGTGKTLIGLLIGEWRRRAKNERVLFLCPTRQLAKQVAKAAREKHGIDVALFVGPKTGFDARDLTAYVTASRIAVGTYSTIFNIKPGIEPPQFLILDDAHAAETYVAGAWSLIIERAQNKSVFDSVAALFTDQLPASFLARLDRAALSDHALNFELIAPELLAEKASAFSDLLDSRLTPEGDKNAYFTWQMVKDHLPACNLFLSPTSFLLRPLIAPTWESPHFSVPTQRLYMSATAGISGDLERMFGRRALARLPPVETFKQRAVGRRLFLFPDSAMKTDSAIPWAATLPRRYDRAAYLSRDGQRSADITKLLVKNGVKVVTPEEIEDDLAPFTTSAPAGLVATARFDGIDLPDDACRMLVLLGRPDAVNLQERFFLARLGMKDILRDRMLTRFTQAVGRCTRGQADYAVIVPIGRSLFEFCAKKENHAYLHPELAAEIRFGLEQMAPDENGLDSMIETFLEQGPVWAEANEDIKGMRDAHQQVIETRVSKFLASSAAKEVDYVKALWSGHASKAADLAREISDAAIIPDLAPYRAWWAYQAASAFAALGKAGVVDATAFRDRYRTIALSASGMSSWYSHVLPAPARTAQPSTPFDPLVAKNLAAFIASVGTRGPKFEEFLTTVETQLGSDAHVPFEQGIRGLGTILGWEAARPGGDADPDGVWRLPPEMILGFEAKNMEGEGKGLSKTTLNQAQGHYSWLEHNGAPRDKTRVIVVSPRMSVHELALPHAKGLWHVTPSELLELFASASNALRSVRSRIVDVKAEETPALIEKFLFERGFAPQDILARLFSRPIENMPSSDD